MESSNGSAARFQSMCFSVFRPELMRETGSVIVALGRDENLHSSGGLMASATSRVNGGGAANPAASRDARRRRGERRKRRGDVVDGGGDDVRGYLTLRASAPSSREIREHYCLIFFCPTRSSTLQSSVDVFLWEKRGWREIETTASVLLSVGASSTPLDPWQVLRVPCRAETEAAARFRLLSQPVCYRSSLVSFSWGVGEAQPLR